MKPKLIYATLLLLVTSFARADSQEQLVQDALATLKSLNTTLDSITDTSSANANAPKIEAAAKAITALADRQSNLPALPMDQQKALHEKYQADFKSINTTIGDNAKRISAIPNSVKILTGPMTSLQLALSQLSMATLGARRNVSSAAPPPTPALPATRPTFDNRPYDTRVADMVQRFGNDKIVTIIITNLPDNFRSTPTLVTIRNACPKGTLYNAKTEHTTLTSVFAPVPDINALAPQLDLGPATVNADSRTITITADPAKLPTKIPLPTRTPPTTHPK